MSDLLTNAAEFTVSEIAQAVKRTVEDGFGHVRVRGEISGFRGQHGSGHAYFTLKDDAASIDAVIWKTSFSRLRFKPEEGMEVIATGRLTTYPRSSKYQIVIEQLEPAGAGALMALLEERRKKLAAEGLFDRDRKRALPYLPRIIGVVTSPTGAVIRDILHRLEDRFPSHVLVWPVRVQGDTCAAEVSAAITGFNALPVDGPIPRPDLLIVARGGGSIEDLWGFNEEAVVRAVAASTIPVISAVGHETDVTLVDHVADLRAPTPTAAAEAAVPVRAELIGYVEDMGQRQRHAMRRLAQGQRDRLRAAGAGLPRPADLVSVSRQRLDHAGANLLSGLRHAAQQKRLRLTRIALNPAVLRQGARDLRLRLADAQRRTGASLVLRTERAGTVLVNLTRHFDPVLGRLVERKRAGLGPLASRLTPASLRAELRQARLSLAPCSERLDTAFVREIKNERQAFEGLVKLLTSVSYQNVLSRGFVLVKDEAGAPIAARADLSPGQDIRLQFADGEIGAKVLGTPGKRKGKAATPAAQESLF